jgi:hypothetical protein
MLAFLQGSAAHTASSLLEQRSAGALLKPVYIHTVLQNALLCRCMEILCTGVQVGSRRAAGPAIPASQISKSQEGGGSKS